MNDFIAPINKRLDSSNKSLSAGKALSSFCDAVISKPLVEIVDFLEVLEWKFVQIVLHKIV